MPGPTWSDPDVTYADATAAWGGVGLGGMVAVTGSLPATAVAVAARSAVTAAATSRRDHP